MKSIVDDHIAIRERLDQLQRERASGIQSAPVVIEKAPEPMALGLSNVRVDVDDLVGGLPAIWRP